MKRGAVCLFAVAACGGVFAQPPDSHDAGNDIESPTDATHDIWTADAGGGWPLSFATSSTTTTNMTSIDSIEIADVTGDGRDDVVVAGSWSDDAENTHGVLVYAQKSDGTLDLGTSMQLGLYVPSIYVQSLAAADVTNDGRTDLVFATANGLAVVAQDTTGQLLPTVTYAASDAGVANDRVALGHFGPDGLVDVVQGHLASTDAMWLWLQTSGGFQYGGAFAPSDSDLAASGDVTGDGRDDVVVSHVALSGVTVIPQTTPGMFGVPVNYDFKSTNGAWINGLAVGDVTGDGFADVIVSFGGNSPDCGVGVFVQHDGLLENITLYDTLDIPGTIRVADMNGDGRADVIVSHEGFEKVGVYLQTSDGSLAPEQLFPFHDEAVGRGKQIAVGDLNGDGKNDIAGIAWPDNGVLLLLSQ